MLHKKQNVTSMQREEKKKRNLLRTPSQNARPFDQNLKINHLAEKNLME